MKFPKAMFDLRFAASHATRVLAGAAYDYNLRRCRGAIVSAPMPELPAEGVQP
jgi:hypothetical protein